MLLEDLEYLLLRPPCRICGWGRSYEPVPHSETHSLLPIDSISDIYSYWRAYREDVTGSGREEFRAKMVHVEETT